MSTQLEMISVLQVMLPMPATHTASPRGAHTMGPVALPLGRMMDYCMSPSDNSVSLALQI